MLVSSLGVPPSCRTSACSCSAAASHCLERLSSTCCSSGLFTSLAQVWKPAAPSLLVSIRSLRTFRVTFLSSLVMKTLPGRHCRRWMTGACSRGRHVNAPPVGGTGYAGGSFRRTDRRSVESRGIAECAALPARSCKLPASPTCACPVASDSVPSRSWNGRCRHSHR
ncbi:hypothetical protein D3C81_1756390 [compost metagenome]